jgi:hypothetical protein
MENPKTIVAADNHETNELRISVPIGPQVRARCQLIASGTAPPSLSTLSFRPSFACRQPAGTIRLCRSRTGSLLEAITGNGRRFTFGCAARRGAQILHWPRRDLLKFLRGVQRPIGVAQHLAGEHQQISLIIADNLVLTDRKRQERSGPDKLIDGRAA